MKVTLIAGTQVNIKGMEQVSGGQWVPDNSDPSSNLAEFAGRSCYQSWNRPNPQTATNHGYLANIIEEEHFSVMEHGSMSFMIEDVSRSLTHELIRHRHASYSQLSQRFVDTAAEGFVVPPLFRGDGDTATLLQAHWEASVALYDRLVAQWTPRVVGEDKLRLANPARAMRKARKTVREAARAVLPNMTPTAILVTGNHRAWRELLEKRGSMDADAEIRELAVELFRQLAIREPNLYQDFAVYEDNGTEYLELVADNVE